MSINYKSIEAHWKKHWDENETYKVLDNSDKPKYYVLDMFPYPSGAGLHVGHPLGYIASDIFARYKRMKGFNVLHPIGFDSFGLPAEEYALQTGIHPAASTKDNMVRYEDQLKSLGFSFDWSRKLYTSDPNYYKWTQWIFTQLYDHYFDIKEQKAHPIEALVATFEKQGNANLEVATTFEDSFGAEEWTAMSAKEQAEVLMNYRLAYRKVGYVNWCEELGTVLANDQVKDGISERGGHPVIQKAMTQWYLRITAYAERMLNDLDEIAWSESLKAIQSNWIGRSEGASVLFDVVGSDQKIEVFTTRPDTIFGATYMVLAPEHDLVAKLTSDEEKASVEEYIAYTKSKSEIDRMAEKEVTGVAIGAFAINPFTNTQIPIWIGEYVLKDYGTGAIMSVPSDDDRDHAFAKKFDLEIIDVVDKTKYPGASLSDKLGIMINSGFMNGMEVPAAITAACQKIEEMGIGKTKINYKLRDSNFSRQRYWGEPFPITFDKDDLSSTVPLEKLPVVLPETDDFKPGGGGKSPLSRLTDWVNIENEQTRETDVMPAVAGSSWYYLRYMDPNNPDAFADQDKINYWQDVDLYVGGAEHAVAHLMYARFWHKFLYDKGLVPTNEPFKKLINQGMIQGVIEFIYMQKEKINGMAKFWCAGMADKLDPSIELARIPIHISFVKEYGSDKSYLDLESIEKFIEWRPDYKDAIFECTKGIYQSGKFTPKADASSPHLFTHSEVGKMSKSKFNVINPDEISGVYGTDCFRMYEMFLGPIEQSKPWDTNGIEGVSKFIRKFWALYMDEDNKLIVKDDKADDNAHKILNTVVKKVEKDILSFSMNTAVSAFMVSVNDLRKANCNSREILEPLLICIAPFAPFISEHLWEQLGHKDSIHHAAYPVVNESYLKENSFTLPVCVNGKKRALLEIDAGASKDDIIAAAQGLDDMQRWFDGVNVAKTIVVPGKMVNFVVKPG